MKFFIFAHPAIIYYNISPSTNLTDKDSSLALQSFEQD